MDTRQAAKSEKQQLEEIRQYMPEVYRSIQAKAAEIGGEAYRLVRRGLRGEPICFWACEAGRVVGTPFAGHAVEADAARLMVEFGCAHVCMWGNVVKGGADGAH